jgi:hypothetical protein
VINVNEKGSAGWAFYHLGFFWVMFLIFLPLSFYEKSLLTTKAIAFPYNYVALAIVLINLFPVVTGNWATKIYIGTQLLGMGLVILEVTLFFKPAIIK